MLIHNSTSLKAYFQTFANQLGIKEVAFGDYDRILARLTKNDFKYPVLWVERPDIVFTEDAGSHKKFKCALTILKNTSNATTFNQEDDIIAECEEMMESIIKKMEKDSNADTFDFERTNVNLQPIERTSGDMAVGIRAEIEITGGVNCDN